MKIKIEIETEPIEKSSHLKVNLIMLLTKAGFTVSHNSSSDDSWKTLTAFQNQTIQTVIGQDYYERLHDQAFAEPILYLKS